MKITVIYINKIILTFLETSFSNLNMIGVRNNKINHVFTNQYCVYSFIVCPLSLNIIINNVEYIITLKIIFNGLFTLNFDSFE